MRIEAEFENGVLRPTRPIALRPGERVGLIIVRRSDPARWDLARLASRPDEDRELAESGLDDLSTQLDSLDHR